MDETPKGAQVEGKDPLEVPRGNGGITRRCRSEMRILRRAFINHWPVTSEMMQKIADRMLAVVENAENPRWKIGASSVLVSMFTANVSAARLALDKARFAAGLGLDVTDQLGDEPVILEVTDQDAGQQILEYGDRPIYRAMPDDAAAEGDGNGKPRRHGDGNGKAGGHDSISPGDNPSGNGNGKPKEPF